MRSYVAVALAAGMLLPACAKPNYVKADKVALGRVVVYRNGVAYYERRANVTGDELRVTVPRDKVDDFLKSLTVVDAKTGKALPVSFPRQTASRYGYVDMTIQLPKPAQLPGKPAKQITDLVLTYVTEAPAWKPSYRVMVGEKGVQLEGWAIVDNTSGEDWEAVKVGVGSSSALSFRFDLWSVRDVLREQLANRDRFAIAPPRGMSPYHERERGRRVVASLDDADIPRTPGHPNYRPAQPSPPPDTASESVRTISKVSARRYGTASSGGSGSYYSRRYPRPRVDRARPSKAPMPRVSRHHYAAQRIARLASKLKNANQPIVIEGYGQQGEYQAKQRAWDRANVLRNRLIENGVAPNMVRIENRGVVAGRKAGVQIVLDSRKVDTKKDSGKGKAVAKAAMPDSPVGESHFESPTPMTVKRGTSVMVSIVRDPTAGQVVYLYDAESKRGNRRYAFKAIRFRNPTESTLETGPVTVYGKGRFIGEGLTDPIPPKSIAVVPFALDRQVIVEPLISKRDHVAKLLTLQRGIVTARVQHVRRTRFKVTSRLFKTSKVYLRHTGRKGWMLTKMPSRPERVGGAHLFKVVLEPGQTKIVDIEEATPIVKTIDLRTPTGMNMMKVFLTSNPGDPEFAEQMNKLLSLQTKMADTQLAMDTIRQRLSDYRVRMDELHGQIVTLKAVKTSGQLMRHLKQKLKEISERVQKSTIDLVNLEETAMKLRIRFQDGIAELTLDKPKSKAASTAAKAGGKSKAAR